MRVRICILTVLVTARWYCSLLPVRAKRTRSFSPSRSSGIPDSIVFSLIQPTISLLITLPLAFTCKLKTILTIVCIFSTFVKISRVIDIMHVFVYILYNTTYIFANTSHYTATKVKWFAQGPSSSYTTELTFNLNQFTVHSSVYS